MIGVPTFPPVDVLAIGRREPGDIAIKADRPPSFMEVMVVQAATQDTVVHAGDSAVLPRDDVVGFRPCRRCHATRERAAHVPGHKDLALAKGEKPLGAANIKNAPVAPNQELGDVSAAQIFLEQGQWDLAAVGHRDVAARIAGCFRIKIRLCHGKVELGLQPTVQGQLVRTGSQLEAIDHAVKKLLRVGALVLNGRVGIFGINRAYSREFFTRSGLRDPNSVDEVGP